MEHKKQALQILENAHAMLARFADEKFDAFGRGAVVVDVPAMSNDPSRVKIRLSYQTIDEVRVSMEAATGASREDAYVLIRKIETYDPAKQAVVRASVNQQAAITIKMRLKTPFLVDEIDGRTQP